jgi:hypothetical protein
MSLLSSVIDGVKNKVESAVTSKLPSISNLTKNTTKLDALKTVGANTQEITQMQYPADLTVASDQPHWVTFYINVRGKSKIAQQSPGQLATGTAISMKGENRLDPASMDNALIANAAKGGAVTGLGIGKRIGSAVFEGAVKKGNSVKVAAAKGFATMAAGGVAGAAAGGLAASMTVKPDVTYRLKDCITLNVSQSPVFHSGAAYDTVDFGALGGFAAGGSSFSDTINASQQNQEALLAAARAGMKSPSKFLTGENVDAMMQATTKQTLNPYREVLFKQVGFRKFSFDYKFYPRSQAETDMIQKIVKTFRYHMHPEISAGGFYYIHPSEFNIQYFFKGKENTYLQKISTCVLTDMSVRYGAAEQFSTFADGAPTEISMTLEFQELETMTKDRVDAGY